MVSIRANSQQDGLDLGCKFVFLASRRSLPILCILDGFVAVAAFFSLIRPCSVILFYKLYGFLDILDFTLFGYEPDEDQGKEGANGLDYIQDPQVLQIILVNTNPPVNKYAELLCRETIREVHKACEHGEHG